MGGTGVPWENQCTQGESNANSKQKRSQPGSLWAVNKDQLSLFVYSSVAMSSGSWLKEWGEVCYPTGQKPWRRPRALKRDLWPGILWNTTKVAERNLWGEGSLGIFALTAALIIRSRMYIQQLREVPPESFLKTLNEALSENSCHDDQNRNTSAEKTKPTVEATVEG